MSLVKKVANKIAFRAQEAAHMVKFGAPNLAKLSVPMSETSREWLKILRRDGIVKIEEQRFKDFADYIDEAYFQKLPADDAIPEFNRTSAPRRVEKVEGERYRAWGIKMSAHASLRDPRVLDFLMTPDITSLLYNYYRRQPYYRNNPTLEAVDFRGGDSNGADAFHTDNFHQISFMLLITDATRETAHMKYAFRSHKRSMLVEGVEVKLQTAAKLARRYPIYDVVGPRGTLFIFDAAAYHRRALGPMRKMFHTVVTTGHHMVPTIDDKAGWDLSRYPEHSRRMFDMLLGPQG